MPIKSHLSNTKNHKTDYNNKKYKSISSVKLTHVKVILEVWYGNEKKKNCSILSPTYSFSISHSHFSSLPPNQLKNDN